MRVSGAPASWSRSPIAKASGSRRISVSRSTPARVGGGRRWVCPTHYCEMTAGYCRRRAQAEGGRAVRAEGGGAELAGHPATGAARPWPPATGSCPVPVLAAP